MQKYPELSSLEIRNILLEALAYEGSDIDSEGKTFKKYDYQGTSSDLYRLAEALAVKKDLIPKKRDITSSAWGGHGKNLIPNSTTNFRRSEIKKIYEQFYILLNQGIVAPGGVESYGDRLPAFHVTEYGLKCLKEKEILPHDIDGFFSQIENIEGITEWVKLYIMESLQCYNANCLDAAVIMLGLANEKIIQELCTSLVMFLDDANKKKLSEELMEKHKASQQYDLYLKYYKLIKDKIVGKDMWQAKLEMDKPAQTLYTNFTRITRNDLVHPSDVKMDRVEVLMIFIAFVKYCKTQYRFINYFNKHSVPPTT